MPEAYAAAHAADFDRWIEADWGLDLQLLGIGRNGHIGFNEPCDLEVAEALRLPTRLVELHPVTRADASRDFGSEDAVIPRALTMGVATILAARSILILATGPHKAEAVAAALTGPMTASVPASLLQSVGRRVTWLLDEAAARDLPRPLGHWTDRSPTWGPHRSEIRPATAGNPTGWAQRLCRQGPRHHRISPRTNLQRARPRYYLRKSWKNF